MRDAGGMEKVHLSVCPEGSGIAVDDGREFDARDEAERSALGVKYWGKQRCREK